MLKNRVLRVTTLLVSLTFAASAAQSADDKSLGELLLDKGYISAEELESVEREARGEQTDESESKDSDVKIRANHKGISFESPEGDYVFSFGGRIQADAAVFVDDDTSLGDGAEIRRARIKSSGTVAGDWDYKLEVNFDTNKEVSLTDGWIRYSGFEPFTITVGHQKVPFGQQSMSSSNWQVFQERATNDAFIDTGEEGRRRLGIVFGSYGEHWNANGGFFAEGIDDVGQDNNDWGVAGRAVWAPYAEKTRVLTFGTSVDYRKFESTSGLRYRSRPEANIAGARFVDTGVLSTSKDTFEWNAETSFVCGRWHGQAEYAGTVVTRKAGMDDLFFGGWYVQAGVFLTGESRNYDIKSGKYGRITPANSYGAWELAVRYSGIDLDNNRLKGGVQHDFTAGVNWWANRNIMVRFNYVYADASPNSSVTLGGENEKAHAFTARTQIVF